MNSLYKSEQGKREILALYDEKLATLGWDYSYQKIQTSFGESNVIVSGDLSKPAMILVHGSNGCAPIALECYANLRKKYALYAVDVLAQPNKSAETRLSMKDRSYGKWMHEIIEQLELKDVSLAGFSFGGLVILKSLEYQEENIQEVFLTAPAYIVNGNPLKAIFKMFLPMRMYMFSEKKIHLQKFLAELFSEEDKFALAYLGKVFKYFKMDFNPVPVISQEAAKKISTPIHLIAAQNDLLFPGEKMLQRARKIFPSLKKTLLLEHSKHVPSMENNRRIEKLILENQR
ncbi:MAG: alpha/beta hydrolase [Chitinophagales bacterium]|nr:alpha/beta hydrolase [Chitinophagales bacterium]